MEKFYLSKSSSNVINTLKSLKDRNLIKEIQNLSVKKARLEFSRIRSYFSYQNKIDVLIKKNFKIRYRNKWIVRQFENEYNPLHSHSGNISGVCYLMLPENFGSKSQELKKNNPNGCIALSHGSEQFISPAIRLIKPTVGKFIFFPNYLLHTVYPFKGKGERRSFSFNADVGF